MTNESRPPPEHADKRWHWLRHNDPIEIELFYWDGIYWQRPRSMGGYSPMGMWEAGWRYLGPCLPNAIVPDKNNARKFDIVCRAIWEARTHPSLRIPPMPWKELVACAAYHSGWCDELQRVERQASAVLRDLATLSN